MDIDIKVIQICHVELILTSTQTLNAQPNAIKKCINSVVVSTRSLAHISENVWNENNSMAKSSLQQMCEKTLHRT